MRGDEVMYVGKNMPRVDAYDKVTGRTKYTDDFCDKEAYVARIVHATIAHGKVAAIDTSEAVRFDFMAMILRRL